MSRLVGQGKNRTGSRDFHATLHAAVGMTAVVAAFPAMVACPAATVMMTTV